MTLDQFIKKEGSAAKAARKIGVDVRTVFAWKSGRFSPVGLSVKKLVRLGISV